MCISRLELRLAGVIDVKLVQHRFSEGSLPMVSLVLNHDRCFPDRGTRSAGV
jgi:hypothetical protein